MICDIKLTEEFGTVVTKKLITRSPTIIAPLIIPYEDKIIAADKAVLNMRFWPKFKKARLDYVFNAASSYPVEHIYQTN